MVASTLNLTIPRVGQIPGLRDLGSPSFCFAMQNQIT